VSTVIASLPQNRGFPGLAMSICEIDGGKICLPSQNKNGAGNAPAPFLSQ